MFTQVTQLRYWKSEHDEQTCEDACAENVAAGLFAVADGAGTTLFSNIWARILVEYFLHVPLMSDDPFEVEWWVRQAQELYAQETPDPGKMAWNARQKAENQGSHSTLATLRISKYEPDYVQAEVLVFGDSCVLIGQHNSEQVLSFPLTTPSDFEQPPICVPSKRSIFNRYFHRCHIKRIRLEPDDVVVLATDAVSKWIISAGSGRYPHAKTAFEEVITQAPDTWAAFITECRARGEMIDDDSTALIITLKEEPFVGGVLPGTTAEHGKVVREGRKIDFTGAIEAQNKELLAITFGDGIDLALEGVNVLPEQIQQARKVSDALQSVLQVLRQEINKPDVAARVRPIWQQYETLLLEEPCAATLRQTLQHIGVLSQTPSVVEPEQVVQVQQEAEYLDTEVITFTPKEVQDMLFAQRREKDKPITAQPEKDENHGEQKHRSRLSKLIWWKGS